MNRYPLNIFWSTEDKGFIAEAPDLPGCSAWGKTEADAAHEAQDAPLLERIAELLRLELRDAEPLAESVAHGRLPLQIVRVEQRSKTLAERVDRARRADDHDLPRCRRDRHGYPLCYLATPGDDGKGLLQRPFVTL